LPCGAYSIVELIRGPSVTEPTMLAVPDLGVCVCASGAKTGC
jgi:hypothetical protein